jgi:hypothetical protein
MSDDEIQPDRVRGPIQPVGEVMGLAANKERARAIRFEDKRGSLNASLVRAGPFTVQ